jgi:hypothetical protein
MPTYKILQVCAKSSFAKTDNSVAERAERLINEFVEQGWELEEFKTAMYGIRLLQVTILIKKP